MRVLIVDDSSVFRRVIQDVLAQQPGIEIVGTAANGTTALKRVKELAPDLMTLDMEMPELDGLGVLKALQAEKNPVGVIVVSALTQHGGELTMKALDYGAFDFITKPESSSSDVSKELIRKDLEQKIKAFQYRFDIRKMLRQGSTAHAGTAPARSVALPNGLSAKATATPAPIPSPKVPSPNIENFKAIAPTCRPEIVLIGSSTGGPAALTTLLPLLPANLDVPILIVQHMPPIFTKSLAESLSSKCSYPVREATHGEVIAGSTAYIAPGGRHMRLAQSAGGQRILEITDDPPEHHCRPSVDYLFRSVSQQCPGKVMAVILTGMGNDGTLGVRLLRRHGCYSIAQEESSCVVYGMPRSLVEAGAADAVLSLTDIAARIISTVRGK